MVDLSAENRLPWRFFYEILIGCIGPTPVADIRPRSLVAAFWPIVTERLIVVSHTERQDVTRIISARPMERKERVIYEQG